jgi:hypothetical protein
MQTPAFAATKTVRTWKLFRGLIWVVATVAASLCPALAFGQTNSTWNGGTGNWSNATDWSPNQVPNNGGGNTYDVTIDSGGSDNVTLDENATISSLTLGGVGSGNDSMLRGSGTLTITGSATINLTGSLDVNVLSVAGVTNSGNVFAETMTVTGTFTNNGRLTVNGVANINTLMNSGATQVNGTLNLTNGITDVPLNSYLYDYGTINGIGNLKTIEGAFDLSNGIYHGPAVTINSNTLTVTGTLYLDFESSLVVNNLTITGGMGLASGQGLHFSTPSVLTVDGTFTNSGIVEIGNFQLGDANVSILNNSGAGNLNIGKDGILTLTGSATSMNTAQINIAKGGELAITNSGGSFVQTSGQTVVDGTLDSVPAVQIEGGTLSGSGIINANVIMGGRLSPGNSPGILTINGNYTQTSFGAYVAELAGLTAGTGYDQLDVNGTADLDGKLDVNLLNGFTVALGDNFILMKYDSETGTFSMVHLPKLSNGLMWDLSYDPGFLDLSVTSGVATTPEPSAYLLWGTVGLLGIGIWVRREFGRESRSSR